MILENNQRTDLYSLIQKKNWPHKIGHLEDKMYNSLWFAARQSCKDKSIKAIATVCVYIKGLTVSFRYWLRYRCFLSACNGRSRIDREGNKQLYPTYNHLRSQVYRYNLLQGHSSVWKFFEMHDWPNSGKFRVIKCRN